MCSLYIRDVVYLKKICKQRREMKRKQVVGRYAVAKYNIQDIADGHHMYCLHLQRGIIENTQTNGKMCQLGTKLSLQCTP